MQQKQILMKVTVTQEDIVEATKRKSDEFRCVTCPVARAVSRALSRPCTVTHESVETFVKGLDKSHVTLSTYSLPTEVSSWIAKFDAGIEVKPFTFNLSVD